MLVREQAIFENAEVFATYAAAARSVPARFSIRKNRRCGLLPSCLQAHGPPVQLEGIDYSSSPMAGWLRFFTVIQCFCRPPRYVRSRCLETNPWRPMRQAARNKSGPISPGSKGATVMRSGRRAKAFPGRSFRRCKGRRADDRHPRREYRRRKSAPHAHLRQCSALKSEMSSTPSTTASPSMTNCFCRFFSAASAIQDSAWSSRRHCARAGARAHAPG